jgi:hypothetical protein
MNACGNVTVNMRLICRFHVVVFLFRITVLMEFDQQQIGKTWDLSSRMYLDLNTQCLQTIQHAMQ